MARACSDIVNFPEAESNVMPLWSCSPAAAVPFCITVDHQTKEDNTVTIRHRDTMEQQRVPISALRELILKEVDMNQWLRKLRLEN